MQPFAPPAIYQNFTTSRTAEDNPTISDYKIISRPPLRRPHSPHLGDAFCMKKTFRALAISQNFTNCCACHRKVTLQLQQILRLPRKMNLIMCLPRVRNVIYHARSNKSYPPTSPNTAPARHFQCVGARQVTLQTHQVLRLPRNFQLKISARNPWSASADIKRIRGP